MSDNKKQPRSPEFLREASFAVSLILEGALTNEAKGDYPVRARTTEHILARGAGNEEGKEILKDALEYAAPLIDELIPAFQNIASAAERWRQDQVLGEFYTKLNGCRAGKPDASNLWKPSDEEFARICGATVVLAERYYSQADLRATAMAVPGLNAELERTLLANEAQSAILDLFERTKEATKKEGPNWIPLKPSPDGNSVDEEQVRSVISEFLENKRNFFVDRSFSEKRISGIESHVVAVIGKDLAALCGALTDIRMFREGEKPLFYSLVRGKDGASRPLKNEAEAWSLVHSELKRLDQKYDFGAREFAAMREQAENIGKARVSDVMLDAAKHMSGQMILRSCEMLSGGSWAMKFAAQGGAHDDRGKPSRLDIPGMGPIRAALMDVPLVRHAAKYLITSIQLGSAKSNAPSAIDKNLFVGELRVRKAFANELELLAYESNYTMAQPQAEFTVDLAAKLALREVQEITAIAMKIADCRKCKDQERHYWEKLDRILAGKIIEDIPGTVLNKNAALEYINVFVNNQVPKKCQRSFIDRLSEGRFDRVDSQNCQMRKEEKNEARAAAAKWFVGIAAPIATIVLLIRFGCNGGEGKNGPPVTPPPAVAAKTPGAIADSAATAPDSTRAKNEEDLAKRAKNLAGEAGKLLKDVGSAGLERIGENAGGAWEQFKGDVGPLLDKAGKNSAAAAEKTKRAAAEGIKNYGREASGKIERLLRRGAAQDTTIQQR